MMSPQRKRPTVPCSADVLAALLTTVRGATRDPDFPTDFTVSVVGFQLRSGAEADGVYRIIWPHGGVGRLFPECETDARGAWWVGLSGYEDADNFPSFAAAVEGALDLWGCVSARYADIIWRLNVLTMRYYRDGIDADGVPALFAELAALLGVDAPYAEFIRADLRPLLREHDAAFRRALRF